MSRLIHSFFFAFAFLLTFISAAPASAFSNGTDFHSEQAVAETSSTAAVSGYRNAGYFVNWYVSCSQYLESG